MRQNWPERLWLVRHGQSQGNVARDAAHEAGLSVIDIDLRDVDVPLVRPRPSPGGGDRPLVRAPCPTTKSPKCCCPRPTSARARPPRRFARRAGLCGGAKPTVLDERLREREFGVFDRLTTIGIREKYPEEAEHRAKLGKFYHRPPGGESWADVILRLRSVLNTINLHYCDRRVLIVCHQVVVLCIRYILEELNEADILAIDRQADVLNCGIALMTFEPDQPPCACRGWCCGITARRWTTKARPRPPSPTR